MSNFILRYTTFVHLVSLSLRSPQSPKDGYSHVDIEDMAGMTEAGVAEVRFYCTTSAHDRVVHFKTDNAFVKKMAWDGSQAGNQASFWSDGHTELTGHSSEYLPGLTNYVDVDPNGGFASWPFTANMPSNGCTSGAGCHRWSIAPAEGRFCCDDEAGYSSTTLHQVWIRTTLPTCGNTVRCAMFILRSGRTKPCSHVLHVSTPP